jgi:hypothetical protein
VQKAQSINDPFGEPVSLTPSGPSSSSSSAKAFASAEPMTFRSVPTVTPNAINIDWSAFSFKVAITAVSASNLPKTDTFGKIDAFVVLSCGEFRAETPVIKKVSPRVNRVNSNSC